MSRMWYALNKLGAVSPIPLLPDLSNWKAETTMTAPQKQSNYKHLRYTTDPGADTSAQDYLNDQGVTNHDAVKMSNTDREAAELLLSTGQKQSDTDELERQIFNRIAKAANPTQAVTVEGAVYGIMQLIAAKLNSEYERGKRDGKN